MLAEFFQRLIGSDNTQPRPQRQCLMCGECCKSFGGHLHASAADLKRWREHGREDILAHVGSNGWLWVAPHSHQILYDCPFLEEVDSEHSRCGIHEIKPDICNDYPTLAHARRCLKGVFLQAVIICANLLEVCLVEPVLFA